MTARLDIIVGQVKNALCVPISAVKTDARGSYVERITKDKDGREAAEKIYITLGLYGEEFVEVAGGDLNPDDDVSITYEVAEKNTSTSKQSTRRMGGPPPM